MAIILTPKTAFAFVLCATTTLGQQILPSNSSSLDPPSDYPRFHVQAADPDTFPTFDIAPLAQYRQLSRTDFVQVNGDGILVQTSAADVNGIQETDLSLISCDPSDYDAYINAAQLLGVVNDKQVQNTVIFYTRTASHCEPAGWPDNKLPPHVQVFTTVDPNVVTQVIARNLSRSLNAEALVRPNLSTYINSSAPYYNDRGFAGGPATAKAMVILYAITGVITTLFVAIIITGAIRAHRHPERYGPRRGDHARGRQSRAKGIARALLDTIPIVKYGDQQKSEQLKEPEIDMVATSSERKRMSVTTEHPSTANDVGESSNDSVALAPNADGSDELGSLGCSICTEDFHVGEEVRVLPCNHKFHPDCVDPWLLNVSGTCPLCRVDLRSSRIMDGSPATNDVPPLASPSSANTSTIQNLRALLTESREERIAALRRFRTERRNRTAMTVPSGEDERRGLTNRLTAMFKIRTRTHSGTGGGGGSVVVQDDGPSN